MPLIPSLASLVQGLGAAASAVPAAAAATASGGPFAGIVESIGKLGAAGLGAAGSVPIDPGFWAKLFQPFNPNTQIDLQQLLGGLGGVGGPGSVGSVLGGLGQDTAAANAAAEETRLATLMALAGGGIQQRPGASQNLPTQGFNLGSVLGPTGAGGISQVTQRRPQ